MTTVHVRCGDSLLTPVEFAALTALDVADYDATGVKGYLAENGVHVSGWKALGLLVGLWARGLARWYREDGSLRWALTVSAEEALKDVRR